MFTKSDSLEIPHSKIENLNTLFFSCYLHAEYISQFQEATITDFLEKYNNKTRNGQLERPLELAIAAFRKAMSRSFLDEK